MSGLELVFLAKGTHLILTMNLWADIGLCDGATGTIVHWDDVALYHKSTSVVHIQNSKREDHNSPTWRYHCN